ncbi:MAG TPA: plastocyanin/azurin family copper-binding protein [Candidatus Limnocylindria bacterium]|nr:plastocyanin/azurin family copper-binding protein [Candidatus Limnocylindria bacterium]
MHQTDAIRRTPVPVVVLAASLMLVLAACSGGSSATPTTGAATPPATTPSAATGSGGAASGDQTVSLQNFAFSPTTLTVPVGTKVTFTNNDSTKHTATEGKDGKKADGARFDLQLDPGASDSFTFDTAGTYNVTCLIHSSMNMTITVQ